ncbi:twin transmembrane helix small protein [Monaibacterium marinum]|uniref:twin transmembrane helix small protein n=1 Tax=Pontivivens marinum TaxID=1690039 RepID=UPI00318337C0
MIGIACLAVLVVLLIGVGGFAKGGEFNKKYANKIMRLRILMQFIAVIVIVGGIWLAKQGG